MATAKVDCPAGVYTKVADAADVVLLEFRGQAVMHTVAGGAGVPAATLDGIHFSEGEKYGNSGVAFTQDVYVKPAGKSAIGVMVSDQ